MKNLFIIIILAFSSCSYKLFTLKTNVIYEKSGYIVYTPLNEIIFFKAKHKLSPSEFLKSNPKQGFRLLFFEDPEIKEKCDTVIISNVGLGREYDTIFIAKVKLGYLPRTVKTIKESVNTFDFTLGSSNIDLQYELAHNKEIMYFKKGGGRYAPLETRLPPPYSIKK